MMRSIGCIANAIAMGIALHTATGAQTVWTGPVNGDWNSPGHWDNGVPDGNDAFLGAAATLSTSAETPEFLRLNLQNPTGLLTVGHAMTLRRLDDNHTSPVGNGTAGSLRIITGGNLTLNGDSSDELFDLHGFSAISQETGCRILTARRWRLMK